MTGRRFELVLLALIHRAATRTGSGFGNYAIGMRDTIEELLPLVNPNDSAKPAIDEAWAYLEERLR